MSSYVKPQVLVFQEFTIVPTEITEPLRAHISGPNAMLHRYSDKDEKPYTLLGAYNRLEDTFYPWPQRTPGGEVDRPYTKVYVDDAMLQYFNHNMGETDTQIYSVPGKPNWIRSSNLSFKSNGPAYPRSSAFMDRDVQLGDVVELRAVSQDNDCEETVLTTHVTGFTSEDVPSRILPAEVDPDNADSYSATHSSGVDVTVTPVNIANSVTATVKYEGDPNANTYDGLVEGVVVENYTVEVVKSSVAGCQAARLRIISESGTDDVAEVQPNDFDDADGITKIGTRGLSVQFTTTGTDQFVVGQKWEFDVKQQFTKVFAVSAADNETKLEPSVNNQPNEYDILGAYAGAKNDTYIVEVTRGGRWDDLPQVMIRTAKGLDFSGPTEITRDGYDAGAGDDEVSFAIGTNGVKVRFVSRAGDTRSGQEGALDGLRKGDQFYVTVNSKSAGRVQTLILRDDLPVNLQTLDDAPQDKIGGLLLTEVGVGYDTNETVSVTIEAPSATGGVAATASAVINANGQIDNLTLLTPGSGYTENDFLNGISVTITPTGTPSQTTNAVAEVTGLVSGEDMDLKLFIKDDIQISENRIGYAPMTNYFLEDTQICIQEGIIAYHPEWTSAGAEQPLPVMGGKVYVEYREWLSDLTDDVQSINDVADLDQIPGQLDPDNILKWGVYKALANSNGTAVKYTAVIQPEDMDSWVQVLERIKGRDDMYNLIPLTFDVRIHNLWAAHIDAESNEYANNWKAGFVSTLAHPTVKLIGEGAPVAGVLGTEQEEAVLAVVADDPAASNTQYTQLTTKDQTGRTVPGNFITNGVQPGDIVRFNYVVDGFGEEQYEEFLVDQVISDSTLLLYTAVDAAVTTPQRVEIWHNRNRNEIVEDIVQQAGALSNRRICAVWPDQVGEAGTKQPGYYLAAALAGLASGVVPHQPLTNVEVSGFDDFTRSYKFFNETQLNRLGEAGVWIVTEDRDGTPHTRHALTTDNLDLNRREEMIRRNVDSMSYLFYRRLRPYIGRTNAQPGMLEILETEVTEIIEFLAGNGNTLELGSQLISGEIRTLRIHPLLADRIEIVLDLVVPAPLNNIELHLVI
jgi:hypothetical protein